MTCDAFGACGSCRLHPGDYEGQLQEKIAAYRKLFEGIETPTFTIVRSPESGYRARAEFGIWHEGEWLFYAMRTLEGKGYLPIAACPIVDIAIAKVMEPLRFWLQKTPQLRYKLFGIEFLSASTGELLVTLLYHRALDDGWREAAQAMADHFGFSLVGRSRGQKIVIGKDYIIDEIVAADRRWRYRIYEGSFSQPNRSLNAAMISWAMEVIPQGKVVTELYCGGGNFTIPLATKSQFILATEISKSSIAAAKENMKLNDVENILFARLSAEEFTQALHGVRRFTRLGGADLSHHPREVIVVDPPRAGLDEATRSLAASFETILYISCSPESLRRDLEALLNTHRPSQWALFDQFPYTNHIESGVMLVRR